MRWRTGACLTAVLVGLVLSSCSGGPPAPPAPPAPRSTAAGDAGLPDRLARDADVAGTLGHLRALQAAADRGGGTRALGSSGYDASVDVVADVLRRAGFRVETPTVATDEGGTKGTTRTVVAQTTTGSTDDVVLAGAHLDGVDAGPGINDDASGSAALLEIASSLGGAPPVAQAVRFVWFGAEEQGLVGSKRYLQDLTSADRRSIAVMINADMIASSNAGYFVLDGDNSERKGTSTPPGSAEIERRLLDRLGSRGAAPRSTPLVGDSDYGPFADADIAAGGVTTGSSGTKTPAEAASWGGRAGVAYDPCYHRACDTLAALDPGALGRMLDALAYGVGSFAVDLRGVPPRSDRATN